MNATSSVLLGIVSSLIATGIFISISEIFRRIVVPWYSDKIYRGVRIDGKWILESINDKPAPETETMVFELTQKGDIITGTYCHTDPDNSDDTTFYSLSGVFQNSHFSAILRVRSPHVIDAITMLLYVRYEKSKLRLRGGVLASGKPGEVVAHTELEFRRKES